MLLRALPALALGGAARPMAPVAGVQVQTDAGTVRGMAKGGVRAFLGIPYGRVPGRFRPPEPPLPWSGIRDATAFGAVATQRLPASDVRPAAAVGAASAFRRPSAFGPGSALRAASVGIVSSEQCLSVNIWSPERAAGLPVLVWVHGGANVSGASLQPIYDGARFARSGVVCVTFNYRLGLFGFLELGAVLDGYRGSGNNALRDQLLLLAWVRDNIAAFGGDPHRVTLAGESAGAKDVAALLASPASRGLFHRAIMESGGGRTVLALPQAYGVTRQLLDLLGLSPAQAGRLLTLDTCRLLEAQHALMANPPYAYPLRPLVDPASLLPAMPETAIGLGAAAHVPLLLGTNRDESQLFLARGAASRPLAARNLSNMDQDRFEQVLRYYDASMSAQDPAEIRWRALTAEEYWIPSVRLAEAQSDAGGAVWMYRFDKPATSGRFEGRAAHVSELPYVWDNPDDPMLAPLVAGFDATLAARMHAAWVAFITDGVPAAHGLPVWPRYEASRRATMILDTTSRVAHDPAGPERRLWSKLSLADAR